MVTETAVGKQSIALMPQDVVANASVQAKLLMDIVDKTQCYQIISGKKYLQVEAWETIGAFNSVHAVTEVITPIIKDGSTVGYDAKVNLVNQDGLIVGSAIMPCYFTENACKGKEGDAKDKAAKSAAQTFATSKAYRMNYSYIAILAGYQPTPAEEMGGETKTSKEERWCKEHNCPFEKKGKGTSSWYAHKLPDGSWCNETKIKGNNDTPPPPTIDPDNPPDLIGSTKTERDPDTIKSFSDLYRACSEDFTAPDKAGKIQKMQPYQVIAELGVGSQSDLSDTPAICYQKIAAAR